MHTCTCTVGAHHMLPSKEMCNARKLDASTGKKCDGGAGHTVQDMRQTVRLTPHCSQFLPPSTRKMQDIDLSSAIIRAEEDGADSPPSSHAFNTIYII